MTSISPNSVPACPVLGKFAILCSQVYNRHYRDTVAHNIQKGGDDTLWAFKVNAFENQQMMEIAKIIHWDSMAEYYENEANNASDLIRGKLSPSRYRSEAKKNEEELRTILEIEYESMDKHENNFKEYEKLCSDLAIGVIARAKGAASN